MGFVEHIYAIIMQHYAIFYWHFVIFLQKNLASNICNCLQNNKKQYLKIFFINIFLY